MVGRDAQLNIRNNSKIDASIGFSRKWDAQEAGREVATSALKKLETPPSFFLLFSTIHYKDHGGFQEFLSAVLDVLPEGTPLIGGTIAGFINNYGCYARGATALAVSYPNMDVAVGYGIRTKRNPKKAARNCADMIRKELEKSPYKNKFLINMISAPIIPKIPFMGEVNNVKSRILGAMLTHIGMPIAHYFGTGVGKEQDVIEQLAVSLPEYYMIGGSSVDDGRMLSNYQFIGDNIFTNSVTALACSIDIPVSLKAQIAVHKTEKKFKITDATYHDYIVKKIEGKSASNYFLEEILEIPPELFYTLGPFYYKTSDYFPMTFEENSERVLGVGSLLGNNILLSHKMAGKNVVMCSTNGSEILRVIDSLFLDNNKAFPFIFISSSTIYSFILRNKTIKIKDILDKHLGDLPYLMIQPIVENIYIPGEKPVARAYSTNVLSLLKTDV